MRWRTLVVAAAFLYASPARAAERLPCPETGRAAVLEQTPERLLSCRAASSPLDRAWAGHAYRATGRFADAAQVYRDLAAGPNEAPLGAVFRLAGAQALREAGRPGDGLELLVVPESPAWLRAEALAARAELLFAAGRSSEAAEAAGAALAAHPEAVEAIALLRLRAALTAGDAPLAGRALRSLRTEFVGRGVDAQAEALARSGGVGSPLESLGAAGLAERWKRRVRRGGVAEVAAECVPLLPRLAPDASLPLARLECGKALAATRHAGAEALLEGATGDRRTRAEALLAIARVRGRKDDPAPIAAICGRLAKLPKAEHERAECEYLAGFVLMNRHPARGRKALEAMADRFARHPRAADARWQLVFHAYEAEPKTALAQLEALVRHAPEGEALAQALYWRGRAVFATDPQKSREDWTRAAGLDPLGYYGWLAATRLGGGAPPVAATPVGCEPWKDASGAAPPEASFARALEAAGFGRLAAREIDSRVTVRTADALTWAPLLEATDRWTLLHRIGLARGGARSGWPVEAGREAAVHAAFPISFPTALEQRVPEVDRCLLLAVMRRESLYDPGAVSQAKARGLLQLLPETAAQLARELGRAVPAAEELHDPALNVLLSSHYLRRLSDRFSSPLLVAAAYNAGPRAVLRWLRSSGELELDLFVERIPYRETRHYVKAVGGALAAYRLLTTGHRPSLSLAAVAPAPDGIDY